jgi:hypothetical protein
VVMSTLTLIDTRQPGNVTVPGKNVIYQQL